MENQFKECLFSLFNLLWPLNREEWRRRLFFKVERWLDIFLVFYRSRDASGRSLLLQATAELIELLEGLSLSGQVSAVRVLDAEKRLLVFQSHLLRARAFKRPAQIKEVIPQVIEGGQTAAIRLEKNLPRQQLRGNREGGASLRERILDIIGRFDGGCERREVVRLLGNQFSPRTVYRYLESLDEEGVLRKSGDGMSVRYDIGH